MGSLYNFYCDESCHLPNDGNKVMVLGGIWCPKDEVNRINQRIRDIKNKYNLHSELKWVKISESKKLAYFELINYFFDIDSLHFRVLVVDNKDQLRNDLFHQSHDDWYYKMYFNMLKAVIDPTDRYNIYMDIKDTKSKTKIRKLNEVLSNSIYDFSRRTINNIQVIRSHEVEIMQIVDILIGAIAYHSRGMNRVTAKMEVLDLIKKRSGYSLDRNTLYRENKFNIFHIQLESYQESTNNAL